MNFCNYGYRIFNPHWNKGYGTEIAKIGLNIGFEKLKIHRIEASIDLDHKISQRIVKKIGMKKEGIRKKFWLENGKWTDQIIYTAFSDHLAK